MADNPFAQFAPAAAPPVVPETQNPFVQFAPAAAPQATVAPRDAATVQAEYNAQPWYGKATQAVSDVARLANEGLMFGGYDKLIGAIMGTGADAERAKTQEARSRAGTAGTAAEIGGSLALPLGAGVTLAGRLGTGAMTGLGGVAARTGLAATEGAGYGALNAAGHDQDLSQGALTGAIMGAAAQPLAETATRVVGGAAGLFNRQPAIPTTDQLRQAGDAAYQASENAGVVLTPQVVDRLRQQVVTNLGDFGYDPALQPGAAAVLARLDDLVGQNVSLKGLDTLRKVASNGYQQGNRSNNNVVGMIVSAIDDVVANPQTGDVLTGNGQAGVDALTEARRIWSQMSKADRVENAVNRADLRAASTGVGGNADNATRQNLRRIAEQPRGFTPDETVALEAAVRGSPTQNFLRAMGRLSPTAGVVGGGVGAATGAAIGSAFGPGGSTIGAFAVPAIGQASKWTADAMTADNVRQLLDIIRAGGTRAAAVAPPNAVQRGAEAATDPLARAIMMGGINGR